MHYFISSCFIVSINAHIHQRKCGRIVGEKTMSAHTGAAPHLTLEERDLVTQLRDRLIHVMPGGIPCDLDTDLNLARWIRGYQRNIDRITKVFIQGTSSGTLKQ